MQVNASLAQELEALQRWGEAKGADMLKNPQRLSRIASIKRCAPWRG
jgi:hypothetical protein